MVNMFVDVEIVHKLCVKTRLRKPMRPALQIKPVLGDLAKHGNHLTMPITHRRLSPLSQGERRGECNGIYTNFCRPIGSRRMRLPVAAKIALVIAGTIGEVPGSPVPVGAESLFTMLTLISGASLNLAMR